MRFELKVILLRFSNIQIWLRIERRHVSAVHRTSPNRKNFRKTAEKLWFPELNWRSFNDIQTRGKGRTGRAPKVNWTLKSFSKKGIHHSKLFYFRKVFNCSSVVLTLKFYRLRLNSLVVSNDVVIINFSVHLAYKKLNRRIHFRRPQRMSNVMISQYVPVSSTSIHSRF